MKCNRLVEVGRRQFLRGGLTVSVGAAAAPFATAPARAQTALARVEYPANRLVNIANIADLEENEPLDIAYPDEDSPGVPRSPASRSTISVPRRSGLPNPRRTARGGGRCLPTRRA